jgi:hypothetical protein
MALSLFDFRRFFRKDFRPLLVVDLEEVAASSSSSSSWSSSFS